MSGKGGSTGGCRVDVLRALIDGLLDTGGGARRAGPYLRLIDSCITLLKAQGPSRTCNESKEEEEEGVVRTRQSMGAVVDHGLVRRVRWGWG